MYCCCMGEVLWSKDCKRCGSGHKTRGTRSLLAVITSGDAPLYTALKNAEPGVRAEAIEEVISRGLPNVSSVIADA